MRTSRRCGATRRPRPRGSTTWSETAFPGWPSSPRKPAPFFIILSSPTALWTPCRSTAAAPCSTARSGPRICGCGTKKCPSPPIDFRNPRSRNRAASLSTSSTTAPAATSASTGRASPRSATPSYPTAPSPSTPTSATASSPRTTRAASSATSSSTKARTPTSSTKTTSNENAKTHARTTHSRSSSLPKNSSRNTQHRCLG
mmetsp:Transcript_17397/g.52986  ORF Transcript_17397/g.52986 Transcript_17397/m.52986 type:complete len:201 (-) Transcript_17397:2304-2906(-)